MKSHVNPPRIFEIRRKGNRRRRGRIGRAIKASGGKISTLGVAEEGGDGTRLRGFLIKSGDR